MIKIRNKKERSDYDKNKYDFEKNFSLINLHNFRLILGIIRTRFSRSCLVGQMNSIKLSNKKRTSLLYYDINS
jgi:hypothetical protein